MDNTSKATVVEKLVTFAGYAIIAVIAFKFMHFEITVNHDIPNQIKHCVYSSADGVRIRN